jgi:hypothetical protein
MAALPCLAAPGQIDSVLDGLQRGLVTGLYDGSCWFTPREHDGRIQLLRGGSGFPPARIETGRFHLVMDLPGGTAPSPAFLDHVSRRSQGVGLVGRRAGVLLQRCRRILAPRNRSGFILFDRSEVQQSAVLSLGVSEPFRAVPLLEAHFPDLRVEAGTVHLTLQGHAPEEVLCWLREAGLGVTASRVWYRLLETEDLEI